MVKRVGQIMSNSHLGKFWLASFQRGGANPLEELVPPCAAYSRLSLLGAFSDELWCWVPSGFLKPLGEWLQAAYFAAI